MDSSSHFYMSWDLFEKFILEIKSRSDELNDDWSYHKINDRENSAYISKKLYKFSREILENQDLEDFDEDINLSADDGNVEKCENLITYEFHIVYNVGYSCPMLCFNAWKTSGALLTMEECWQMTNLTNLENKYEILTQLVHPILMRPFLTVHPCKTSEFISTAFENSKNPVVSWLSAVGPAVGLIISPEYANLTF